MFFWLELIEPTLFIIVTFFLNTWLHSLRQILKGLVKFISGIPYHEKTLLHNKKKKGHLVAIQKKSNNQNFNAFWIMSVKFEPNNQAWGSMVLDNLNYNLQFTIVDLIFTLYKNHSLVKRQLKLLKAYPQEQSYGIYNIFWMKYNNQIIWNSIWAYKYGQDTMPFQRVVKGTPFFLWIIKKKEGKLEIWNQSDFGRFWLENLREK
jgi:hypothetical protein